jgi:tryptophanyl-tRNA synthetase
VTDPTPVEAPKNPDKSSIYSLYRLFATPDQARELANRFRAGGLGYGDAKSELFGLLWDYFKPYREKREQIVSDKGIIEEVRKKGAQKARVIAMETMEKVRELVGVK